MPKQNEPLPFVTVLHDLMAWLRSQDVPAAIIGGLAASHLGRPRVTRDVDLIVMMEEDRWGSFITAGERFNFQPRRKDCLEFAVRSRVVLVRHVPSRIDVDLIVGSLPFEAQVVQRAVPVRWGGVQVPIATPEDLIVMKAVSHRPRDTADIEGVLDAHPKLNKRRIRTWVAAFARALEQPELISDLERLFARQSKRR